MIYNVDLQFSAVQQSKSVTPIYIHIPGEGNGNPVFLPGESQGQRSLVGCCLWGRPESDTTEATEPQQQHTHIHSFLDSFPIKRIMAIVSLNDSFPLASGTRGHTGQVFLLPFTPAFLLSPLLHYATPWATFLMLIHPLLFIVNYS